MSVFVKASSEISFSVYDFAFYWKFEKKKDI